MVVCGGDGVAIDFRQSPDHPYPAQVADVNLGIRWLKTRATDFNADPNIVGGLGGSSGGHTVLLSAMKPNHPAYSAIDLPKSSADATLKYLLLGCPIVDPYERYLFVQRMTQSRKSTTCATDKTKMSNHILQPEFLTGLSFRFTKYRQYVDSMSTLIVSRMVSGASGHEIWGLPVEALDLPIPKLGTARSVVFTEHPG